MEKEYRLTRLHVASVGPLWNIIRQALTLSWYPGAAFNEESMANIQESIMIGRLTVWPLTAWEGDKLVGIKAMAVTTIAWDDNSANHFLYLYALAAFEPTSMNIWSGAFKILQAYARTHDCVRITARSANPRVIKMVEALGGQSNERYLTLEV